ncbi:MAG TPA: hypothetical protein VGK50_03640 [Coriobacteriia bacterium]
MSDQDFFFDEEDEKPAKAEKAAPAKAPGRKASAATSSPAAKTPSRPAPASGGGSFFDQEVNMGIASLVVVIALLLGMLLGVFIGQSRANNAALLNVPAATNTGGGSAPPLSQDQLKSGQLPAGHPSIGATGSTTTTK